MKASISEVKEKIASYVHSAFLDREYITEQDLPVVKTLLQPYSNVRVSIEKTRYDDGHLDCVISVDAFLGGGTLRYGIRSYGGKNIMIR